MLTRLVVKNFKLFEEIDLELGERVVCIGPNNSGKTSALQALALWQIGVRKWVEKRGTGMVDMTRSGVTINRKDLVSIPVPTSKLLWRNLRVRFGYSNAKGKAITQNVRFEILVEGIHNNQEWKTGMEFDYANEESIYCRPMKDNTGNVIPVSPFATDINIAYLPPMSGLASIETRIDPGAIHVRLGEGRTAEILRNICHYVASSNTEDWRSICDSMSAFFGIELQEPQYIAERGEITMKYRDIEGNILDLTSGGRGQQQTLLLLAHMYFNRGSILLLDEPDAHLEILRQRQIYQILTDTASVTGSQIVAASHSEIILNEAADRDIVLAFVGKPHRIDDRGSQIIKSLKEIGFEHYFQAENKGCVFYLEGSTDLAILRAFASTLDHTDALKVLERPYVVYIGNLPSKALEHFYGLREAKTDLVGIAIYDRLDKKLHHSPQLKQIMWHKREIENYLCQRETLIAYAGSKGKQHAGDLFAQDWSAKMDECIEEIETALQTLGKPSPWSDDTKASDDFLGPLFQKFYNKLGLPNLMLKSDYHQLAVFVPKALLDPQVTDVLNAIVETASNANPRK